MPSDKRSALRIFFFSDWRIQPLELAEELIKSAGPLDVIVYGLPLVAIDRHAVDIGKYASVGAGNYTAAPSKHTP